MDFFEAINLVMVLGPRLIFGLIRSMYKYQGPVVGPYLHIVVVVTIYPLAHRYIVDYS